jgi:hypothetical protein
MKLDNLINEQPIRDDIEMNYSATRELKDNWNDIVRTARLMSPIGRNYVKRKKNKLAKQNRGMAYMDRVHMTKGDMWFADEISNISRYVENSININGAYDMVHGNKMNITLRELNRALALFDEDNVTRFNADATKAKLLKKVKKMLVDLIGRVSEKSVDDVKNRTPE